MLLLPITLSSPRKLDLFVYLQNNMWFSIYGTGYVYEMYCAGLFLKFLEQDMPTFTKNALFEPALTNRKWPTCLGQLEEQLKKWVGTFPITTDVRRQLAQKECNNKC